MPSVDRSELLTQIERLYRDGTSAYESDGQLLDRYLTRRDESAFETIVERHGPLVLSLCRRFLHDRCDVEDAFQATFLILARKAESIRKRPALSSWLYGVAYKVATRARGETLRRRRLEASGLEIEPAAMTNVKADDLGPALDQELDRLPEKFRAPLVLCYLKEQTHDQAAAELRWPVGTVRSRLARGRALLRDRLIRRGCSPVASLIGSPACRSLGRFTAPVPPSLIAYTVAEAGRFVAGPAGASARPLLLAASLTSVSTSSGSATTLAHGVLTTMAFTPIKLVAAGLTAGVLMGGLGTGAYSMRTAVAEQKKEQPAPAPPPRPVQEKAAPALPPPVQEKAAPALPPPVQEKAAPAPPPPVQDAPPSAPLSLPTESAMLPPPTLENPTPRSDPRFVVNDPGVDARLNVLERKLDLLLERIDLTAQHAPTLSPDIYRSVNAQMPTLRESRVANAPPAQPAPNVEAMENLPSPRSEAPTRDSRRAGPPLDDALPQLTPHHPDQPPTLASDDAPRENRGGHPSPSRPVPPLKRDDNRSPFEMDGRAASSLDVPPSEPGDPRNATHAAVSTSIRETEAAIRIALAELARNGQLYRQGALSQKEFRAPAEHIQLLIGRLRGVQDELSEETERQQNEIQKAQAELQIAQAEQKASESTISRYLRLRKLKGPGMVSEEDMAKAESGVAAATARVAVKQVGVSAATLRARQLKTRSDSVREILANAEKRLSELLGGNDAPPLHAPTPSDPLAR